MTKLISVTVDDAQAQATFDRLTALGRDNSKAMRAVSLLMKQEAYSAFRFQKSPNGAPWPGLSPLTLAARRRKGNHSQQPLISTGAMYASIEAAHSAADASVTVGSGLPDARAWYNQFGTLTAPERPMLPMSESSANPTQEWLHTVMAPVREALEVAAA